MTTNPYQSHANALLAIMTSYGINCPLVIWGNKPRRVIANSPESQDKLSAGGFSQDFDMRLETVVSEFTDHPSDTPESIKEALLNSIIGYNGEGYKAVSVKIRPGGLMLEIAVNSVNQNA